MKLAASASTLDSYRLERVTEDEPGFLTVYEGTVAANGARVSIRSFPIPADRRARKVFRRAAKNRVARAHPGLAPAREAVEHDGRLYVVTEASSAPTLVDRLARSPLEPQRAVRVVEQIAAALDGVEWVGDAILNSTQILVEEGSERGVLLDPAKAVSLREVGWPWVHPYPHYAPPEMGWGEHLGPRSVVYSLGCILFECVTGSPPFEGDWLALIEAHSAGPIPRVSERRPELGTALDAVLARAMAKDAGERLPSAGDLVKAAMAALRDEPGDRAPRASAPTAPSSPATVVEPPLAEERHPDADADTDPEPTSPEPSGAASGPVAEAPSAGMDAPAFEPHPDVEPVRETGRESPRATGSPPTTGAAPAEQPLSIDPHPDDPERPPDVGPAGERQEAPPVSPPAALEPHPDARADLGAGVETERVEAERREAERREAERREAERVEAERVEAERRAAEREEAVRKEAEQIEAKRLETQRRAAERKQRLEAERRAAEREERLEAERRAAEREEAVRKEAERKQSERRESELRKEAERRAAEQNEAKRLAAARKEAERKEAERKQSERREAERKQRLEAERRAAEHKQAERRAAEHKEAERKQAERRAAEHKEEAERKQAERRAAEQAQAKREEVERKQAEREQVERKQAERIEVKRLEAERKKAGRTKAERKEAARKEAARKRAQRKEARRIEAERAAAERAEPEPVATPPRELEPPPVASSRTEPRRVAASHRGDRSATQHARAAAKPRRLAGTRRPPPLALFLACGAAVACAVAGYLIGDADTPSPRSANVATTGALSLGVPADWQRRTARGVLEGVRLRSGVAAKPRGSRGTGIVAGRTERTSKDSLPSGLTAAHGIAAEPVRLGRYEAYRHRRLRAGRSSPQVTAYAIPTEGGAAVVACHATRATAANFMPRCERVASTLKLRGLRPISLTALAAERRRLAGTVAKLRRSRSASRQRLAEARTPGRQARQARALRAVYADAGRSFARLEAAAEPPGWKARVLTVVRRIERAYAGLASSAARRSRSGYARARLSVTRWEAGLARLLAGAAASR